MHFNIQDQELVMELLSPEPFNNRSFSENLRKRLDGWTPTSLATTCGIARATIYRLFDDEHNPSDYVKWIIRKVTNWEV